jgi:hypothetical protein
MNELPRRPFTELCAPQGGFADARRVATRRRRAKAAAASTAGAAAVAVVLALSGSSSLSSQDKLRVTTPGGSDFPAPTASEAASPGSAPASQQPSPENTPAPGSSPGAPGSSGSGGQDESSAPQPVGSPVPGGDSYVTPDLVRDYSARHVPLGSGTSFCAGTTTNDDSGTHSTVNWCHSAQVGKTAAGHDLVDELCRDGSSGNTLSFDTSREVDLLVLRGSTVVWRWSTDHPAVHQPHQLAVEADHCWRWTAHWTDVDANGKRLPGGDYVLRVVSEAPEMTANPVTQTPFSL